MIQPVSIANIDEFTIAMNNLFNDMLQQGLEVIKDIQFAQGDESMTAVFSVRWSDLCIIINNPPNA